VQLGDDISITADPATNSLIIHSSKTDYEKVKALIDQLDIKRRQVLVEAMLLEVLVSDNQVLGTDFLTSTGGADGGVLAQSNLGGSSGLAGLLSDPSQLAGFSIAAASAGSLHIGDKITIPTQAVLLSAIQTNENANVLSAPTLLTTDNEEAEIVVGQNVPFLASRSSDTTNLNNTFNTIDRQDVGITLRITPQISSTDFVTLHIFTDVSNIVDSANTDLGPTTNVRSSETTVITKNGQMIVIGGLIADSVNDSENGVPFLKDIPVLGQIFRRTNSTRRRNNLLTFITPRIIQDQYDARETTVAHRDKLEDEFNERDIEPSRSEILHNVDIDRVTEAKKYDGPSPGTIRPATKQPAAKQTADAPLELSVKPKLPEAAAKKTEKIKEDKEETAKIADHNDYYFVMNSSQGSAKPGDTPFKVSDSGTFGVIIPAESSDQAKQFFEVGRMYQYGSGLTFQVTERHVSIAGKAPVPAAATVSWYTLSPFEILSLGDGPWRRK
jgi:hypothetical protein